MGGYASETAVCQRNNSSQIIRPQYNDKVQKRRKKEGRDEAKLSQGREPRSGSAC